jgi:hypothetical protein
MDSAFNCFNDALQRETKKLQEAVKSREKELDARERALEERERASAAAAEELKRSLEKSRSDMEEMRRSLEQRANVLLKREAAVSQQEASANSKPDAQADGYSSAKAAAAVAAHPSLFGGGSAQTKSGPVSSAGMAPKKLRPGSFVEGVDPLPEDEDDGSVPVKRPDAACDLNPQDWRQHARTTVDQASDKAGGIREQFEQQTVFRKVSDVAREDASVVVGQASTNAGSLRDQFEQSRVVEKRPSADFREDASQAVEQAACTAGSLREQFEQRKVFEKRMETQESPSVAVEQTSGTGNLRAMFEQPQQTEQKRGSTKKSLEELLQQDDS